MLPALWGSPRGLMSIRDEIDRIFNRFWRAGESEEGFPAGLWSPSIDVAETDHSYTVIADLPGLSRDDVKVEITDNVLTVSGERKSEDREEKYHRVERIHGCFSRSFSLPSSVAGEKITASFKDGVLTVTLPKTEESRGRLFKVS